MCSVIDIILQLQFMCESYQVSQSFGPRHSNSSPHSSYPSVLYIRGRGEEGLVMWLVDVAKFRPPPHFLVAVSTLAIMLINYCPCAKREGAGTSLSMYMHLLTTVDHIDFLQ